MARYERFSFLCDQSERLAIASLAAKLQRSQSDAVRFVVIEVARQLAQVEPESVTTAPAEEPSEGNK